MGQRPAMSEPTSDFAIEATLLLLVGRSGPDKSICPSEVARAMSPDWRTLMGAVRRVAVRLALAGRIDILRKGKRIEPSDVRGVIRLRAAGTA